MTNELNPIEREIIERTARRILGECNTISVGDGEEFTVRSSDNLRAIMNACGSTEETVFVIRNSDGKRLGFIHFIHGNGEDVISDCTDNEDCERWTKD